MKDHNDIMAHVLSAEYAVENGVPDDEWYKYNGQLRFRRRSGDLFSRFGK
ncbi:MAG: hypothetical protein K6B38_04210 [Ruminococcus sp.]|nr:hypothetical protein [Ruminococcus sp.]